MENEQKKNNLPSTKLARNNGLSWIGKKVKQMQYFFQRGDSKNKEAVDKLKTIEQYNQKKYGGYKILSVPAFKYRGIKEMENCTEATNISIDINDLNSANKMRTKESVNGSIGEILRQINELADTHGIDNRLVSKMGDEIYMLVPNKSMGELSELLSNLKGVCADGLTISLGASDDLSKGFESALAIADKEMSTYKAKWKAELIQRDYGSSIESIIEHLLSRQFDKMRIDLGKLKDKNSDKDSLRNTFDMAMRSITLDDILEGTHADSEEEFKPSFELLVEKYEQQAQEILGDNADPEKVKNYVLGNILSKGRIDGSVSSEYFQKIGYKDTLKKAANSKQVDVLSVGLSGLKGVNDAYGHEAGDRAIESSLSYLQQIIDESGIDSLSPIIEKSGGGGDSYIILNGLNDISRQSLKLKITGHTQHDLYSTEENSKKIYMNCDFQEIDLSNAYSQDNTEIVNEFNDIENSENQNGERFLKELYSCKEVSEANIEEASLYRKISNVPEMKSAIIKIFRQVINLSRDYADINEDTFKLISNRLPAQLQMLLDEEQQGYKIIDFKKIKENNGRLPERNGLSENGRQ